jgi:DNA-binding HxlR family transcriptional regulator
VKKEAIMWRTNEMKACPIDSTFKIIGKRFTALIIRDMISLNETRFNQFMNSIEGLNSKTLSKRLKEMEDSGLIERKIYQRRPINIAYFLTEKGKAVEPILDQMAIFSCKHLPKEVFKDGKPRSLESLSPSAKGKTIW